ncbi:MAG TPA: peptide chain release factor N(5)-glutamine methyltransferase [candidate division Zixibacteria bacterium]|nr:peptide chain release factor N(5)-glutamine methyltransferase [candidate division Zixibacteria bacterium]
MTIRKALETGRKTLSASPSPALDTRLILEYVLDTSHSYIIAHDETIMSPTQEYRFLSLLERARNGEPIPYLVGKTNFYGLEIKVTPSVLIPRPETEQLVNLALEWIARPSRRQRQPLIVDVGTGSGCIALALASALPLTRIEATDVSKAALEVAEENARALGLENRVDFYNGQYLNPIVDEPDLIVANLPYIADHEWTTLAVGVKWHEPDVALRGGSDGMDGIRQLLAQAGNRLAPGGAIILEIGWKQGEAAKLLAKSTFPSAQIDVKKDLSGHDRVVCIYTSDVDGDV